MQGNKSPAFFIFRIDISFDFTKIKMEKDCPFPKTDKFYKMRKERFHLASISF